MKKTITTGLLLLAALLIAWFGTQWWKGVQEDMVSDRQADIKPEPALDLMDFTALKAGNPDIVAWITIEGVAVDYPIVQGADNSYYLTHTAEKLNSRLGALFMDYRAHGDFSDFNTVVYGHYVKSGKMFGSLSRMREPAFFSLVTEGFLYTPGKTYRLEIIASVLAESTSDFYSYAFPDLGSREAHLEMIRARAVCYRGVGVTAEDRLLTLSTCSYEYNGARTLVIARLR